MNIHNNIRLILEGKDPTDSITLDIPLLIRVLELAREDVKDDMELHRITERLLKIRHQGVLTMDDYSFIANMKEEFAHELQEFKKQPDVAEDKDPCWTGYTQVGMKDKGGRKVPNCVPSKGVPKAKGYKESQDSLNPYDQYAAMAPAKTEEVEQIDEISPATKASYVTKAKDQIKQSEPWTKKGEYKDIAKNFIAKREKGIAKANEEVHELDEAGHLDRYIKSLGWDPKLLDMSRKQKYAQSSQYASWRQRQASVRTESMSAHEKFKAGVKKAGYDMDAGAKRLEDLLAKQKKEREEREKAEKPEMKQETMMGKLANSYEPEGDSLVESKHPSKAAMMVKGIFNLHKKRKMNEETYDHEKDDKQEKSLGKKPKLEVNDEKDEFGKEKASARAVLSGGKTETGTPRDTIEIDPMMRNRPGQGDISKKEGRLGIKGQEK